MNLCDPWHTILLQNQRTFGFVAFFSSQFIACILSYSAVVGTSSWTWVPQKTAPFQSFRRRDCDRWGRGSRSMGRLYMKQNPGLTRMTPLLKICGMHGLSTWYLRLPKVKWEGGSGGFNIKVCFRGVFWPLCTFTYAHFLQQFMLVL